MEGNSPTNGESMSYVWGDRDSSSGDVRLTNRVGVLMEGFLLCMEMQYLDGLPLKLVHFSC